jgi:molybdopterin synthase sulfur carrier subunit
MVKILYFARIREAIGYELEEMPLPGDVDTVSGLVDRLQRGGMWEEQLSRPYRVAVNQNLPPRIPRYDGDEVAVFPPVRRLVTN